MAVAIRMSRVGKKKAPFYRIVAADNPDFRPGLNAPHHGYSNELPSIDRFDRNDRTFNRSN